MNIFSTPTARFSKNKIVLSLFSIILLIGGLLFSITQSQQTQNQRSRAETVPTPTPGPALLSGALKDVWDEDFGKQGIVVDQSQLKEESVVGGNKKVGQTFIPTGSNIWRIDFRFTNRTSFEPITFKLWKWNTNYQQTVATPPLYTETVDAVGGDLALTKHTLPKISVTPGNTYYFEIQRPTIPFYVLSGKANPYANGTVWRNGTQLTDEDLAFTVYSGTGTATAMTMRPITGPEPPANVLPPVSTASKITKADYLKTVQDYVAANDVVWTTNAGYDRFHYKFATHYGFLYKATGDEAYAKKTIASFQKMKKWLATSTEDIGFIHVTTPALAYYFIKDSSSLTAADKTLIHEVFSTLAERHKKLREIGDHNRAIGSGFGYDSMAQFFPEDPQAADWKQYADAVWKAWYESADNTENSHGYDSLRWYYLLAWMKVNPAKNVLSDPKIKVEIERQRVIQTPLGPIPPYGSGNGWGYNYGGHTVLFEAAATAYNDGRYKWAAHRVYGYIRDTIKNSAPHLVTYDDMEGLAMAYVYANDTIKETYSMNSWYTVRKAINRVPPEEGTVRLDPATTIPNKFHFLSYPGKNNISAIFELVGQCGGGHGHCGAPSLNHFSSDDSVILTGNSYFDYADADHSTFLFKKIRGGKITGTPVPHLTVPKIDNNGIFTFAEFVYDDPYGSQNKLKRQVLLVKNQFLWIRDSANFTQSMEVSLGPLFAAGQKPFANGSNWFDIGWNEPRGYIWRFKNGNKRALLYFTPQSGKKIDWQYQPSKEAIAHHWSPPWLLSQRIPNLKAQSGTKAHFNTLLIPHEANVAAATLANGVKVLSDSFDKTQLSIPSAGGAILVTIDGSTASVSLPTVPTNTPLPTVTPTKIPTATPTKAPTPTITPTPTRIPTATLIPSPTLPSSGTSVSLQIGLHGIGKGGDNVNLTSDGNFTPLRPQRNIIVQAYDANNRLVETKEAHVVFNQTSGLFTGVISLQQVQTGAYTIQVKVPNYLRKAIPGIITITAGTPTTLPFVSLITGDSNNDNSISILDYNVLTDCYSDLSLPRNCSDPGKKLATDLNDDGLVNHFDYNLLLRELSSIPGQ